MKTSSSNPRASRPRIVLVVAAVVTLAGLLAFRAAAAQQPQAVVVKFDVPVDPGSSALFSRALSTARAEGSHAIVIEMNTPGGLLSDMTEIVSIIGEANQSGIATYTYVPPSALAASAGSYIAMASNRILMGAGSEIGPSTPIVEGGTALDQNHTEEAMASLMVSLAEKWGRNASAAQAMVYSDKAYSAGQAIDYHVADGSASSLQGALSSLGLAEGYAVVEEGTYEQFLSVLSNPNVSGLLIFLGGLALVLDLYHPTFVLSIAGGLSMVAGLVGIEVVGASVLGAVVVLIGVVLMFLELKLGHGFAMVGGALVAGAGIFFLSQGLEYSPSPVNFTQVEAVGIGVIGVLGGLYVRWIVGPLKRKRSLTGSESLVGKLGTVTSDVSPVGEVRIEGITWRARSEGPAFKPGDTVVVKGVEGLVLVVGAPQAADAPAGVS